jgi:hypothetical protein
MMPTKSRADGFSAYTRMTARQRETRLRDLSTVRNPNLLARFLDEGDYVARDLLIVRGIFDDTKSAGLNECAHGILVRLAGATRVEKPNPLRPMSRRPGVMFQGFAYYDVRAHRVDAGSSGLIRLPKPDKVRFPDLIVVLFDTTYNLLGAWKVPRTVVAHHRTSTGLKVESDWREDPAVEAIGVSAEGWAKHGLELE